MNEKELDKLILKVATEMFTELDSRFQSQIVEELRPYPRTTVREYGRGITGKIASSPRDVVDSGRLRDSHSHSIGQVGDTVVSVHRWDASHAIGVWAGSGMSPPYPWTQVVIEQL